MNRMTIALVGTVLFAASQVGGNPKTDDPAPSAAITAAVADPSRPQADRDQDTQRKIEHLLAFAGVKPGLSVADFWPAGGYVTRLLSRIVGPQGHVYSVAPKEVTDMAPRTAELVRSIDADPTTPNVTAYAAPVAHFTAPETLDMVWTTQNYHDFFMKSLVAAGMDSRAFNRAVFKALKAGGIYFVSDHVAELGSGTRDSDALHRIDPQFVMREVLAAGFVLDGESKILGNPRDNHSLSIFDESIRGRTDQFVYRFRKPY